MGLVLALTTKDLIYYIVSYAWAGIGCSFAPAVLLSFYWDRFGSRGVVTALLTGLVTTVAWISTGLDKHVTAMAVTFFVSMGAAVLVTLLSPDKSNVELERTLNVEAIHIPRMESGRGSRSAFEVRRWTFSVGLGSGSGENFKS